jgi:hypothetical protein
LDNFLKADFRLVNPDMKIIRNTWTHLFASLAVMLFAAGEVRAQNFLQFGPTTFNKQSQAGVPISTTTGVPPGSNGKAPTSTFQSTNNLPLGTPTPEQFQSVFNFGALAVPTLSLRQNLNPGRSLFLNAAAIGLPVDNTGAGRMTMLSSQVGASFVLQVTAFAMGAIIPVPTVEYTSKTNLSQLNPPIQPEAYWEAEPYTTNGHATDRFYWSPHKGAVFATQPGQVAITWRSRLAVTPPQPVDSSKYYRNPTTLEYFPLLTQTYIVSGAVVAGHTLRTLYWTEGDFTASGVNVQVPQSVAPGGIYVAWNDVFKAWVTNEYNKPAIPPGTANSSFQQTNTLWIGGQDRFLHAYNLEGRVFVEFLGEKSPDGLRNTHLGFEIVDVKKSPVVQDVTNYLGEVLTAWPGGVTPDGLLDDADLVPSAPIFLPMTKYVFRKDGTSAAERLNFYAIAETTAPGQVVLHWLQEGLLGIRWPYTYNRYALQWPRDPAAYSHYLRPYIGPTDADQAGSATNSAIQLPTDTSPSIAYQDPYSGPRAFLTPDFHFYTVLDSQVPVHRTLLQYQVANHVYFERVYSWLDTALRHNTDNTFPGPEFAGTSVTNLIGWDTGQGKLTFSNQSYGPRVVTAVALVGNRIQAPTGELGDGQAGGTNYLAGHIQTNVGTAYSTTAYVDPLGSGGFDAADKGSIIPVNAAPNNNRLEVLWFRQSTPPLTNGFRSVNWPAVVATYTLQYPLGADQIILASNAGSGPLPSLQARGRIYYQNDPTADGYNPNEEHALMQGGQAFALRDDLNLTPSNPSVSQPYSSQPFVLIEYTDFDGRPSQHAFQVRREAPELGITFDYETKAGTILQAPMPLPLLETPKTSDNLHTLNAEVSAWTILANPTISGSSVQVSVAEPAIAKLYQPLYPSKGGVPQAGFFVTTNASPGATLNTLSGVVCTDPILMLSQSQLLSGKWNANLGSGPAHAIADGTHLVLMDLTGRVAWDVTAFGAVSTQGISITLTVPGSVSPQSGHQYTLAIPDVTVASHITIGAVLSTEPYSPVITIAQDPHYTSFTYKDRKGDNWIHRGPHVASGTPYLAMQFYYKTLPGFYFPGASQQPPVGTVTPYLRPLDSSGAPVAGLDGIHGSINDADGNIVGGGNSLPIFYRPVWPDEVPVLQMAETLTVPKRGLPAVRGQASLQVLYQQSEYKAGSGGRSVLLHDPTRARIYRMGDPSSTAVLAKIPDSVKTSRYQGKTYFPNLPPHLVNRFYFDPTFGKFGGLAFIGTFQDEPVGQKYLLLNTLSASDLAELEKLVDPADSLKSLWNTTLENSLTTDLQPFIPDPSKPGTFKVDQVNVETKKATEIAEVSGEDVAVDSYALTANGPGVGYVTLVAGDGLAFTPTDLPVSMYVVRVDKALYPGEVKIVQSSNPLSEKLILQQVADLAGQTADYQFDWRIASPVDGSSPPVYLQSPNTLVPSGGTWNHLRFPLPSETVGSIGSILSADPGRFVPDVSSYAVALPTVGFVGGASNNPSGDIVTFTNTSNFHLNGGAVVQDLRLGARVQIGFASGSSLFGAVIVGTDTNQVAVRLDPNQANPTDLQFPRTLSEIPGDAQAQAILYRDVDVPSTLALSDLWLSLNADNNLGVEVYLDGQPVARLHTGTGDTAEGTAPTDLATLPRAYLLEPSILLGGKASAAAGFKTHRFSVVLHSSAVPGTPQAFDLALQGHVTTDQVVAAGSNWLPLDSIRYPDGVRAILGGSADVRALADNYLVMRFRTTNKSNPAFVDGAGWSTWTAPVLAEGWIKRVLAGINPFNQRVTDLFNNKVNTDASILTSAGPRWEGDVALNLDSINNYGLIEIYETVLNRGRMLSVDAGINYGPANDALLLAAGYISDLYKLVGDEAWADANNPTISIGSKDVAYGSVATAMFPFMGQAATLMEQQQAMLRGRDDFVAPGVTIPPVYNRLYWNYTRGINSGEVIYALNYDIQPNPDTSLNGSITAADAAHLYPQGHGDAYGHYLTATTGYYSLLMNPNFSWIPQAEAVNVLGVPVLVNYQHERKFAAAAGALGQAGLLTLKLTTRADYVPNHAEGWDALMATAHNDQTGRDRYWSADHWASRVAQGTFLNWVVGNAILPSVDPDPQHEGVQKVDRTTVVELKQLPAVGTEVQAVLDNAEGGINPLGLPDNSVAFDLNPTLITGTAPQTHFEQIYGRAVAALGNAYAVFDDASAMTRLMRTQKDSLADYQVQVDNQERAYTNALIEIYGTPYSDDIGPGATYVQGYTGPDLVHYMYVDNTDLIQNNYPTTAYNPGDPQTSRTFRIDKQQLPSTWLNDSLQTHDTTSGLNIVRFGSSDYTAGTDYISYQLGPRGFTDKPATWTGRRLSPGQLQQAISTMNAAYDALRSSLTDAEVAKQEVDRAYDLYNAKVTAISVIYGLKAAQLATDRITATIKYASDLEQKTMDLTKSVSSQISDVWQKAMPKSLIFGLADGGDLLSSAVAALQAEADISGDVIDTVRLGLYTASATSTLVNDYIVKSIDVFGIQATQLDLDFKTALADLSTKLLATRNSLVTISTKTRAYYDSLQAYRTLVAKGDRLLIERQTYRQRVAQQIQGYRTRDAALRLFRNEKLERYNSLFDTATMYAFLAAQAYDYETGLLNTDQGRSFLKRIVSSRAIGLFASGNPQYAGSDTGDPGLSSALAEMKADWDVLKSRLGFVNPDTYGTIASLRVEQRRTLPGSDGDAQWKDILSKARHDNLLDDPDVRRYCLQIDPGGGLPVPGIVLPFSTLIEKGKNVFGNPGAGGDHAFPATAFATKIFAAGIAFEGYVGMDDPSSANWGVASTGATSPSDPSAVFLNHDALMANPDVYLIPVGQDTMMSPPLGDTGQLRTWAVADIAIPMPFNIGGSSFSTENFWLSSQSLSEPLYQGRKHPAFRPVGSASVFQKAVLSGAATLQRSAYTSSHLIGRSVWNSQWKIVIPASTLLNDPNEGLDRFVRTVKDVKVFFQTYSYSGN